MSSSGGPNPFINTFQEFPIQAPTEMKRILTKNYTDLTTAINLRESGVYDLDEVATGQRFWGATSGQFRYVYRKVFPFNAIPSGGTTLVIPHNITRLVMPTNIYGVAATNSPDWRPIPYVSILGYEVSIRVDQFDIFIQNNGAGPNILSGFLILEYLKN